MKEQLQNVINYLNGEINLYGGKYEKSIQMWDKAWDEMNFIGYNPQTASGIEKYIKE